MYLKTSLDQESPSPIYPWDLFAMGNVPSHVALPSSSSRERDSTLHVGLQYSLRDAPESSDFEQVQLPIHLDPGFTLIGDTPKRGMLQEHEKTIIKGFFPGYLRVRDDHIGAWVVLVFSSLPTAPFRYPLTIAGAPAFYVTDLSSAYAPFIGPLRMNQIRGRACDATDHIYYPCARGWTPINGPRGSISAPTSFSREIAPSLSTFKKLFAMFRNDHDLRASSITWLSDWFVVTHPALPGEDWKKRRPRLVHDRPFIWRTDGENPAEENVPLWEEDLMEDMTGIKHADWEGLEASMVGRTVKVLWPGSDNVICLFPPPGNHAFATPILKDDNAQPLPVQICNHIHINAPSGGQIEGVVAGVVVETTEENADGAAGEEEGLRRYLLVHVN